MTELYAVKVRRDRAAALDAGAEPSMRQYKDVGTDEEAIAVLLSGGSLDVTAVHQVYRQDLDAYPGQPVAGLFVTVQVRRLDEEDPDFEPGAVNRAARVSWLASGIYRLEVLAPEVRVMQAVMARAAQLAELADQHIRTGWWLQRLTESEEVR
jgi:hypothetical protein